MGEIREMIDKAEKELDRLEEECKRISSSNEEMWKWKYRDCLMNGYEGGIKDIESWAENVVKVKKEYIQGKVGWKMVRVNVKCLAITMARAEACRGRLEKLEGGARWIERMS